MTTNMGSLAFRGASEYLACTPEYRDCIVTTEQPGKDYPLNCWSIRASKMPQVMEAIENRTEFRTQLTPKQFKYFLNFIKHYLQPKPRFSIV